MEKLTSVEKWRLVGAFIGLLICIGLLIITSNITKKQQAANVVSIQVAFKSVMEAGYAQGQADALKGTIRVHPINDSTYVWISSPWGTVKPVNDTVNVNILHK